MQVDNDDGGRVGIDDFLNDDRNRPVDQHPSSFHYHCLHHWDKNNQWNERREHIQKPSVPHKHHDHDTRVQQEIKHYY